MKKKSGKGKIGRVWRKRTSAGQGSADAISAEALPQQQEPPLPPYQQHHHHYHQNTTAKTAEPAAPEAYRSPPMPSLSAFS